ncbi:hypothetical protein OAV04_02195 [Candidatus Poseidoniaceae archaeon]|jgi:hypothetical protein|nr:hypothetical protein [Candidatus Poseidoniaceae archaeon]
MFESELINILISAIRETIVERAADTQKAWTLRIVVKSISSNVSKKLDAEFDGEILDLAKRIMKRWMMVKEMHIDREKVPEIYFGSFSVGTQCQWPSNCFAKSPTDVEKSFVKEFHQLVILRDLFCIQDDHLLANRWGGKNMIPLCGLHNRQKGDAIWPTILLDDKVI